MSGIGVLNEKPLHASLKEWYAKPGDQLEVAIDGFVIDIVRDDLLLEVVDRRLFEKSTDWRSFVPEALVSFTARDLAEVMGVKTQLAQRMVYCLRKAMVIELIGKRGRANLYRVAGA